MVWCFLRNAVVREQAVTSDGNGVERGLVRTTNPGTLMVVNKEK